ncbi:MAG TPA: DUF1707 and DUF4870 domain-containing protein [Tessaracoccus flavescens]|uniref:DUF1707 and DUF4870 domain-containing protein n=1 Tax=Tessaracoccus flavescens TaxID=399497 RepID=A0A921EPI7_9ACTN|nr:DUF1707 and DUF4870 domain-containing protein [Tessaracoccus flavescens]
MSSTGFSHLPALTDNQRDRAIAHLQACYANGSLDEGEFHRRLDAAFAARDRVELNRTLLGLARVAPAAFLPTRSGQPSPADNAASGLTHLAGIVSGPIVPAVVRAVATPGSRLSTEAGRALSFQLTTLVLGLASFFVGAVILDTAFFMFAAWAIWFAGTIWASVRAFNGKSSLGSLERFTVLKQEPQRRQLR